MSKKRLPINVYLYYDYRRFLADLFTCAKRRNRRYSFREFSRTADFAAPNMLKQVIDGKRNLNRKTIEKIVKAFDFNMGESEYFQNLVYMNQAKSHSEKDRFYRRMAGSRQYSMIQGETKAVYRFYAHWYYPVIREMVLLDDFCSDPAWIARRISPSIRESEAKKAFTHLVELGHIARTESGAWVQSSPLATTGPEIESIAVTNFHKAMISMAAESLETLSHEERNVTSLTLAASPETYAAIVDELQAVRRRIVEMAVKDTNASNVFQLNLQLFPVTTCTKETSE
jgi:uncharacterized protein (TIGR02147 family)